MSTSVDPKAIGWSWQEIADALCVSRQAVHKKHRQEDLTFERFSREALSEWDIDRDELRRALEDVAELGPRSA